MEHLTVRPRLTFEQLYALVSGLSYAIQEDAS